MTFLPGRRLLNLLVAIFLGFPLSVEAGLAERGFETHLSNGMKVILLEDPKAPMVTFQVWYRVGSRNEAWGKSGLSHLLEHLMFKGTREISAGDFIRTIVENGGNYNAFTSRDFTAYFEDLSADRAEVAMKLEADRMQNLAFTDEDFTTERMVVVEERLMRTDNSPQGFLMEQVDAAAFQAQPYHWPAIGWAVDLARLTAQDAREYYRRFYNPSNAFLVVVGDFKRDELLPKIEGTFGSIPRGVENERFSYIDPPQAGERRVVVSRKSQVPAVILAYHAPKLGDPDGYALDVAATLLSGGKSSRLYLRLLHQERTALSADADNSLVSVDPSLFQILVELLPGKEPANVESLVEQELERLRTEPVGERELEKAKNQLEAMFIFQQDSVFMQAMMLAMYEIADTWKGIDDYIPSIRKVTSEDVQRAVGRYLTPDKKTAGILRPLPPTEGESAAPMNDPPRDKFIRNRETPP